MGSRWLAVVTVLLALLGWAAGMPSAARATPAAITPAATTRGDGPLTTPHFRHYDVSDGLPGGEIYAMTQDANGYMWFGTTSGLARYDGVSFKIFRHHLDSPHSLPGNGVYALQVDRAGQLWIGGVSSGLSRYEAASDDFRSWRHADGHSDSLSNDEVWALAQTPDGSLWVGTQSGLDRLRPDGHGFDHLRPDGSLQTPGDAAQGGFGITRALLAEDSGRLWIATEYGLFLRSPDGRIKPVPVDPAFQGAIDKVWRIDGSGDDVRVACSGGLLKIGEDGVARPFVAQLGGVRSMSSVRDHRGRLWVGTTGGVAMIEPSGRLQMFEGHPLMPGGLPADWVWQVKRDREGGMWFATSEAGVAYLTPRWDGFVRFTHIPDVADSLAVTSVGLVQASRDGKLWVGVANGVDKLDPATGAVEHVIENLHEAAIGLAEDPSGRLWIAGSGVLSVYQHGQLKRVDPGNSGMLRPNRLVVGNDGRIYAMSWGAGVFAIDPDTQAITPLPMARPSAGSLAPAQLSKHQDGIWYASEAGLARLDPDSQQLVDVPGVPRRRIISFSFDQGGLWIEWESGLDHYRLANGAAELDQHVKMPKDWQDLDVRGIRADSAGGIWALSTRGLWHLDIASGQFKHFGPQDGLFNGQFNYDLSVMLPDGTIYGATKGGVVGFSSRRLARATAPLTVPRVTLASMTVRRDGEVVALPTDTRQPLKLGWGDRDLRVSARVASFVNPPSNRYRFRLRGFDTDWVDVDGTGVREFAGLGAGSYSLQIMAAGPDEPWGELAAPLHISIDAPPWARWWAWTLYVLVALVLGLYAALSWRQRLAQRHRMALSEQQRDLAEQASAAKTEFLATLSHEIRTPMTGVIGMAELLLTTPLQKDQDDYAKAIQRSGALLLKLLNDALDLARIEAGRLELDPGPFALRVLLEDVARLTSGQARARGIDFVLALDPRLPARLIGDAVRVEQILLNLTNNAVKFTERGSVTLAAEPMSDGVLISVTDTGPGIPEASQARLFQRFEQVDGPQRQAGSGLGLAICRELVGMMGGSIELESRVAHGSTFRVRLPLREPEPEPEATLPKNAAARVDDRFRVLLVEDDETVAAVIRGLLQKQRHMVSYVANGLGALAELSHASFDVLLLDLDLPGVDGFQIARLVRQRESANEHLPMVAITARAGGDEETRTRAAGMDGFLRKPFTGDQLAGAMAAAVIASLGRVPAAATLVSEDAGIGDR